MKKVKIIAAVTALFLYFFLGLFSTHSSACGTVRDWVQAYYEKGPIDDVNKKEALIGQLECVSKSYYQQGVSDRILLPMLLDALMDDRIDGLKLTHPDLKSVLDKGKKYQDKGSARLLIEAIYHKYDCLAGAADMEGYKTLKEMLGSVSCPGEH
jgi:hypothetical protein